MRDIPFSRLVDGRSTLSAGPGVVIDAFVAFEEGPDAGFVELIKFVDALPGHQRDARAHILVQGCHRACVAGPCGVVAYHCQMATRGDKRTGEGIQLVHQFRAVVLALVIDDYAAIFQIVD